MKRNVSEDKIAAIETAEELSDLAPVFETESVHEIYFRAKEVWKEAVRHRQETRPEPDGLPGRVVSIDGHDFHVHGVTHAGTEAERQFLKEHVSAFLDRGAVVYCEQGIRPMYFEGMDAACEMDDYLWAVDQCKKLEEEPGVDTFEESGFDTVVEDSGDLTAAFRERAFELIDAGSSMYGERFEKTLGDIAAEFLIDHSDLAVGKSYEAFRLSREASKDPQLLHELQQYYERSFLPQPLEREWLRRHDPELEILSHARNERMADYAVYHNQTAEEVHLIVGAAHQPGVLYYLEAYSDGKEPPEEFELF